VKHLPNILTFSRILVIPALIVTFYFPGRTADWTALALFCAAGITDFLDGYVARQHGYASSLGQFLDPVADKLLVASVIVMLVFDGRIAGLTVLAGVVILSREILVSGLREFLAEIRVGVPVSRLAKWKTGVQMLALGFLLSGEAGDAILPATDIGRVGLWIAALLTIFTGYDYLRAGLAHIGHQDQGPDTPA
jgi:cardiolipin synthase